MKLLVVTSVQCGLTILFVFTSALYSTKLPKVTEKVIFDIKIDGQKQGSIVIGLFGEIVPKTVKIFTELAKAKEGEGYKGSTFSDTLPWFVIQGGDISRDDGREDGSVYGGLPNDENFILKHDVVGRVSVANSAINRSNGFEFFIIAYTAKWLNGKHVVFGQVLEGMNVVENISIQCRGSRSKDCKISDSKVVEVDEPFTPDI